MLNAGDKPRDRQSEVVLFWRLPSLPETGGGLLAPLLLSHWRLWLLGIAMAVTIFALANRRQQPRPPQYTRELCACIELGMLESDVVGLLGGPAGDHTTDIAFYFFGGRKEPGPGPDEVEKEWLSNTGMIRVRFNQAGHVVWKRFDSGTILQRTWLQRLRDWLGFWTPRFSN